jgi:hypothetical protein
MKGKNTNNTALELFRVLQDINKGAFDNDGCLTIEDDIKEDLQLIKESPITISRELAVDLILFGVDKCKYFRDRTEKFLSLSEYENDEELKYHLLSTPDDKIETLLLKMYP